MSIKNKIYILFFSIILISCGDENGKCIDGDCTNGFGEYVWNNGDEYKGYWKGGIKEGKGVSKYKNNGIYEGYHANNKREGYGEYMWISGTILKGYWKNDKKHGKCTLLYNEGSVFIGEFVDDEEHGHGFMTWGNESQWAGDWYKGQYIDGARTGHGTYFNNRLNETYIGEFKNAMLNGEGYIIGSDSIKDYGHWEFDKRIK